MRSTDTNEVNTTFTAQHVRRLDFNSDNGGFSYSLTNVVHPSPGSQPAAGAPAAASPIASKVQSEGFVPSAYYNVSPMLRSRIESVDPSSISHRSIVWHLT